MYGHAVFTGTPEGYAQGSCSKAGYAIGTDLPTDDADCGESSCRCDDSAYTYMCMVTRSAPISLNTSDRVRLAQDWTMGSTRMVTAENAFRARTGIDAIFGVGTDGCTQTANSGGAQAFLFPSIPALTRLVRRLLQDHLRWSRIRPFFGPRRHRPVRQQWRRRSLWV